MKGRSVHKCKQFVCYLKCSIVDKDVFCLEMEVLFITKHQSSFNKNQIQLWRADVQVHSLPSLNVDGLPKCWRVLPTPSELARPQVYVLKHHRVFVIFCLSLPSHGDFN